MRFLLRHKRYLAIVVGLRHAGLGPVAERVVFAYGNCLDVSMSLVSEADLFVGVDSCMLHVADFYRVPGVGLFGPTRASEFGFLLMCCIHVQAEYSMDEIEVGEVLLAAERVMDL